MRGVDGLEREGKKALLAPVGCRRVGSGECPWWCEMRVVGGKRLEGLWTDDDGEGATTTTMAVGLSLCGGGGGGRSMEASFSRSVLSLSSGTLIFFRSS